MKYMIQGQKKERKRENMNLQIKLMKLGKMKKVKNMMSKKVEKKQKKEKVKKRKGDHQKKNILLMYMIKMEKELLI